MANERKARGCFFWGTITMVLVIIGVLVGLYFGTRKAIQVAVSTYTASAPAPIPVLEITPEEQERITGEIQTEVQSAMAGRGARMVELDERRLNVLLRQAPAFHPYTNQIYLEPEGDKLQAHLSVPLDQFQHWRELGRKIGSNLGGRYFNGTALLNVTVTNGVLNLSFEDLVVNGQSLPANFLSRVQAQNFAQQPNADPELQAVLRRIDQVTIGEDKVRLHFK